MSEAVFTMPLQEYWLCDESEFMERIQAFGKQQGIPDGTRVELEYAHWGWQLHVKLSWDALTNAQQNVAPRPPTVPLVPRSTSGSG